MTALDTIDTTETAEAAEVCTLDIEGMTCASCVRRIEKAVGKLDGVNEARVNLATEVASITYDPQLLTVDDLTAAVTKAGYTATPRRGDGPTPAAAATPGPEKDGGHADFDTPGLYRLWGQFRLGDGQVITVPFTIRAS